MSKRVRSALAVVGAAVIAVVSTALAGAPVAASAISSAVVVDISPESGQVVGIAQPVTVRFSGPVADRSFAERVIIVDSSRPVSGRFIWLGTASWSGGQKGFWPAYTPVKVTAGGMSTSFDIGAAVMAVASISAHTFTVSIDGETIREMPASLGKPGFDTPLGTFKVLEKQRNVTFDSRTIGIPLDSPEGYLIDGEYGVRITWGGVYVHSAPWSVGSQGKANVSHGCINLSPDNAAWYFSTVRIGDPVLVQA